MLVKNKTNLSSFSMTSVKNAEIWVKHVVYFLIENLYVLRFHVNTCIAVQSKFISRACNRVTQETLHESFLFRSMKDLFGWKVFGESSA